MQTWPEWFVGGCLSLTAQLPGRVALGVPLSAAFPFLSPVMKTLVFLSSDGEWLGLELRDSRGPLLSLCPRFAPMLGPASTLLGGLASPHQGPRRQDGCGLRGAAGWSMRDPQGKTVGRVVRRECSEVSFQALLECPLVSAGLELWDCFSPGPCSSQLPQLGQEGDSCALLLLEETG